MKSNDKNICESCKREKWCFKYIKDTPYFNCEAGAFKMEWDKTVCGRHFIVKCSGYQNKNKG